VWKAPVGKKCGGGQTGPESVLAILKNIWEYRFKNNDHKKKRKWPDHEIKKGARDRNTKKTERKCRAFRNRTREKADIKKRSQMREQGGGGDHRQRAKKCQRRGGEEKREIVIGKLDRGKRNEEGV